MTEENGRPGQSGHQNSLVESDSTAMASRWLDYWFAGRRDDELISIDRFKPKPARSFRRASVAEAVEIAMSADATDDVEAVYFRSTTLPAGWTPSKPGSRGAADDSARAYGILLDCDIHREGEQLHKASTYPPDWETWEKVLDAAALPPLSCLIDSGAGFYPGWTFSEPMDCSPRVAKLLQGWRDLVHEWAQHLGGWKLDSTFDLARVYGLPGTRKRQGGQERWRRIVHMDGPRYSIEELERALLSAPRPGDYVHSTDVIPDQGKRDDVGSTDVISGGSSLFEDRSGTPVLREGDRMLTRSDALREIEPFRARLRDAKFGDGDDGVNAHLRDFARVVSHYFDEETCRAAVLGVYAERPEGWTELDENDITTIRMQYGYQARDRAAGDLKDGWIVTVLPDPEPLKRRVDLRPYLDGTYVPPAPSVGGARFDGATLLYPGRWHTLIAKTASGKSWFALFHAVAELRKGNTVVYAHFEESSPGGTLDRLRQMAPDLSAETIEERFIWLDCTSRWQLGEFGQYIPEGAPLTILDGINAAAGQHGEDPSAPGAVTTYKALFVTPATLAGAAVLSCGHPPKARDRQKERHGFGSTAWLDDVDGVGFRLVSGRRPISRGKDGYSMLYSVKDRYGQVELLGHLETDDDMEGWYTLGVFHVDDSTDTLSVRLNTPQTNDEGGKRDAIDELADAVLKIMFTMPGMAFASHGDLSDRLKAEGTRFTNSNLTPALLRLVDRGKLDWPDSGPRRPRPGRLTAEARFESQDVKNSLPPPIQ